MALGDRGQAERAGLACTVTLPGHGVMTVEDAVRRLGLDAAILRAEREVEPEDKP
ncbi:hypothetical protein HD597_003557 [Nonomuraea thailandensis]|uniref:Uncharacterized protein n=1 Tax=Nonomuraea thailandensis TaxID=1188745 RepID=A0A9X2GD05_9ACTN|nr:hypothetical protein [Nonomuraea thailandensis]MCP2356537.1 hypothetical protein [Nonomuraea thailandensis]